MLNLKAVCALAEPCDAAGLCPVGTANAASTVEEAGWKRAAGVL
jgi:hypothetical protein